MFSQLAKDPNGFSKATLLCKCFHQHVVYEQARVLDIIEDFLSVVQVPKRWVSAEDHEFVEGVMVLVETNPEDLGLDLFEMGHGFAVLQVLNA